MTDAATTPRVNRATMPDRINSIVRFVGRVQGVNGNVYTLRSSDDQDVQVRGGQNPHALEQVIEVIGRVQPDLTIEEYKFTTFSADFDMAAYNTAVNLSKDYPEIFG